MHTIKGMLDVKQLLKMLATEGRVVANFDNSLVPLDVDAGLDVVQQSMNDVDGMDSRMHFVSLRNLIVCSQKLNSLKS